MKRVYGITALTVLMVVVAVVGLHRAFIKEDTDRTITVGFLYVGDASNAYTNNFIKIQNRIDNEYGDRVHVVAKYNVSEGAERSAMQELVDAKCDLIFSTSYGFEETTKEFAEKYPQIQFCMATGDNANKEPVISNYHTFMGTIYQGRYISGVVAGMKLEELIEDGTITKEQAKVGYVGAFPYAEVISGYTAFLMGVRSVVPEATMTVIYTDSWGDYLLEKKVAGRLIEQGCVILSQHSDTSGPAVACEQTDADLPVYLVSYNKSMAEIAPTTYLIGSKVNWEPYMMGAVEAVLLEKPIETYVEGNVYGNDMSGGLKENWVQMLELNEVVAAKGSKEKLEAVEEQLKKGEMEVFRGDYTGVNPEDPSDVIDLKNGYHENEQSSAPTFHYILENVVTIDK